MYKKYFRKIQSVKEEDIMKIIFKPIGWFYYPTNVLAFIITIILAAAFVHDLLFIDSRSHSVSDLFYNFAPYGFMYFAIWLWIGSKASK